MVNNTFYSQWYTNWDLKVIQSVIKLAYLLVPCAKKYRLKMHFGSVADKNVRKAQNSTPIDNHR